MTFIQEARALMVHIKCDKVPVGVWLSDLEKRGHLHGALIALAKIIVRV